MRLHARVHAHIVVMMMTVAAFVDDVCGVWWRYRPLGNTNKMSLYETVYCFGHMYVRYGTYY